MKLVNADIIQKETEQIKEIFYVQQEGKKYRLIMVLSLHFIYFDILDINDFMQSYEIKLNLEQIKKDHKTFSDLDSLEEFKNIIKDNLEKNEVIITKISGHIIRFELKKNSEFFELTKKKNNIEGLITNLYIEILKNTQIASELKNNYNKVSIENKNLKEEKNILKKNNEILIEEIKKLKDEIKQLKEKEKSKKFYCNEIKELFNTLKDEIKKQEEINQYEKNIEEKLKNEAINHITEENSLRKQKGTNTKNNIRNGRYTVNRQKLLGNNRNNTEGNLLNDSLYSTPEISKINKDLFQKKIKNNNNIKDKELIKFKGNKFIKIENRIKNNKKIKTDDNNNNNNFSKRLSRNNSNKFKTPVHLFKKKLSSYSANKIKYKFSEHNN